MRKLFLLACATAGLSLGAALPASADVQQLGSVNIAAGHFTHVRWARFDGPVARLRFVPENDTIECDHIDVTYHDGTTHEVFSGVMTQASTETVTFPEGDSRIAHVDFTCMARSRDGARIALSALSEGKNDTAGPELWERHTDTITHTGPVATRHAQRVYEGDDYPR